MRLCNKRTNLIIFLFGFSIEVAIAEDKSWLVYTNASLSSPEIVIRLLSKNGTNETHIPARGLPTYLTFDFQEKKIYWSMHSASVIHRANIDGTNIEIVLDETEHGGLIIRGLALDWITKNIYFALSLQHQIMACDIRRQRCAVLLLDSKNKPAGIALHPLGTMVWTNHGELKAIFKASMDGSHPTQITADDYGIAGPIVIDHAHSRLYWISFVANRVHTSDLDGKNESTLDSIGNTSIKANGLALTEQDIYWFDDKESRIKKCNKNDRRMFEVEKSGLKLDGPGFFDIILMWSGSQPNRRVNHCANNSCSHVCVLTETSYRCACPDGLTFSQDGQHCDDPGPKMLISTSGGTYVLSMTTLDMIKISNSSTSLGLSYNYHNSKIYWAGGTNGSMIFSSDLNGSDIKSVVTVPGGEPIRGLAYDWIAHNLYYTNENHIGVCDGSGTSCAVLLQDSSNSANGIALFPRSGFMFWNAYGQSNSTIRAHMDGSSAEIFDNKSGLTNSLVIDHQDSQLYRYHRNGTIITTDFYFKLLKTHDPWENQLKGIAVGGDNLYWTNNKRIDRCDKYDDDCWMQETVKEFNWNETVFQMSLFHREGQLQDRVNHCAGGLCSHICVLTEKYFRCICPTGMYLMKDSRTCGVVLETDEDLSNSTRDVVSSYKPIVFKPEYDNGGRVGFRGSSKTWMCADRSFVDVADLCNGTLGCPDGTDEGQYCDIPCSKINRTDDGEDCMQTPNGPQILCPQGCQPAAGGDTNECLENVCESYCVNTDGSFQCRELPEGSGEADGCGGKIVANSGTLQLEPSERSCLWVITLQNTTGVHLEVSRFMLTPVLVIPQQKVSNLNHQSVWINGSTDVVHKFEGKSLAILVPNRTEKSNISWKELEGDISRDSFCTKFVNEPEGKLEWTHESDGRNVIFWAFNFGRSVKFSWSLDTVLPACDPEDPCESIYLTVLIITPAGFINEIQRTCEGSSELSLKVAKGSQLVVFLHINAPVEATTSFGVEWNNDEEGLIA